tara:strand:+ start:296 stop:508 length:213 start_codon:yes stop_codon:yes gene_type:complete
MPKFKPYEGESPSEALKRISDNIEKEGLPALDDVMQMVDARDRVENYKLGGEVRPPTSPSLPQYKKGGKV